MVDATLTGSARSDEGTPVTLPDPARVKQDFDRIADLPAERWDHNVRYHRYLLRHLPERFGRALEVGCGTGAFARELASRAESVLAVDLSPRMIAVARDRSEGIPNLDLRVLDVTRWEIPADAFDCIASLTTLHHLPARETLSKFAAALRPGGSLLVLDVLREPLARGVAKACVAFPANALLNLVHNGRLRSPREIRDAWDAHGRGERYASLGEMQAIRDEILPGARLARHLFWRYSLVWRKPPARS